jgi:DNA-binding SARP family transcriptional activator
MIPHRDTDPTRAHVRNATLRRNGILMLVGRAETRLISAVAPAGFGKTTVAEMIGAQGGTAVVCDALRTSSFGEFAIRVIGQIERFAPTAATRLSVELFALERSRVSASRLKAFVLDAWTASDAPDTWIFDNLESIADQAESLDLLVRLIGAAGRRRLVLCSRSPLALLNSRIIPPNEHLRLHLEDLAFSPDEMREILGDLVGPRQLERVEAVTQGWPVAVLLLRQLARAGRLDMVLEAAGGSGLNDLRDYLIDEVLGTLGERAMNVLMSLVATRDGGRDAVYRTARGVTPRALHELTQQLPVVDRSGGRYRVHPMIVAMLEETQTPTLERLRLEAARSYESDGMYVEAARLYLSNRRIESAADCLEREMGSYLDRDTATGLDELLEGFPALLLPKYPRLWASLAYARRSSVKLRDLIVEGETLRVTLRSRAESREAKEVDAVLVTLATQLGMDERAAEILAERSIDEDSPAPGDLALSIADTIRRASNGRIAGVWERYGSLEPLIHNDLLRAFFSLRVEVLLETMSGRFENAQRALERAIVHARAGGPEAFVGEILRNRAVVAWLAGDDAAVERFFAAARGADGAEAWEASLSEALEAEEAPRDRALLQLVLAGNAANDERRQALLDQAEESARGACDLWTRLLVAIARSASLPARRETLLEGALGIAREIDLPSVVESVESLIDGGDGGASFAALARRFAVTPVAEQHPAALRLNVLSRTAYRGVEPIALSNRVWALVEILAVRKRVRRETLVDILWGDDDPAAGAHALKVLVSRARQQLGDPSFIVVARCHYSLCDEIAVDYDELERLTASLVPNDRLGDVHRRRLQRAYDEFKGIWVAGEADSAMSTVSVSLSAQRHEIVELLARDALDRGKLSLALDFANELRRRDSRDETAHEVLVRAHIRAGNRASALREYRTYGERLRMEFGTEPSFTIEELDLFPSEEAG